jgi:release factor glutamine methyltransferase
MFGRALCQRCAGTPLQHLTGEQDFRRITLQVRPGVFVPRPETEVLVGIALDELGDQDDPVVADVGTGTGAIALALKDERPDAEIIGVDVSQDALALAGENAKLLGLEVDLREGGLERAADGWDLVVSNPPYVDTLEGLQPELHHEPEQALVGTGFHERIAHIARARFLVLEVGDGQADAVAGVLADAGYHAVTITPDLAGISRVVDGSR